MQSEAKLTSSSLSHFKHVAALSYKYKKKSQVAKFYIFNIKSWFTSNKRKYEGMI